MSGRPFIVVALDDPLPPFQQIFEQIRAAVERGDIAAGAQLPTVRQLAGDLGVAPNTVARAYTELQDAGWLVGEGRRGTRVAGTVPDRRTRTKTLREAIGDFIGGLERRGYSPREISDELKRAT